MEIVYVINAIIQLNGDERVRSIAWLTFQCKWCEAHMSCALIKRKLSEMIEKAASISNSIWLNWNPTLVRISLA